MPNPMLVQACHDVLALYEAEAPAPAAEPSVEDLRPWRDRIDALDRAILQMLNERSTCANAIGHLKKQMGLPIYVPEREQEVIRNVKAANQGPLPDAAVQHIFERIIDETRSLERHKYQDEQNR